ncbi:MAG: SpoIIIAH-like family protein [Lachnospiraceae bacterium]|nr:SpoIIIAH-like family protein [Lachnospiraceae bacterium]
MKFVFKRNHIIITVLAALIAVAGYLNYVDKNAKNTIKPADTGIEETTTGNEENADKENTDKDDSAETGDEIISNDIDIKDEPGQAIIVNGTSELNFAISARLSREQLRANNKELLMSIIESDKATETERQQVIEQLILITQTAEKENAAETLLESKGYEGAVVTMTNGSVDVIVAGESLTDVQRAQIEDVVKRKTEVDANKITITTISD